VLTLLPMRFVITSGTSIREIVDQRPDAQSAYKRVIRAGRDVEHLALTSGIAAALTKEPLGAGSDQNCEVLSKQWICVSCVDLSSRRQSARR
jgi:hypothetical protein